MEQMAYQHVLTDDEKRELLRIARATLREFLRSGRIPPGKPHRESLLADANVFISLEYDGVLRGYTGTAEAGKPIYRVVQETTVAAANGDEQFTPIQEKELDDLRIEISVLGPSQKITTVEDIEVGNHGIVVQQGEQRGLLLPQVAAKHHWDAETFLGKTCIQAGLDKDAWRDAPTIAEAFTVQVFGDPFPPAHALRD